MDKLAERIEERIHNKIFGLLNRDEKKVAQIIATFIRDELLGAGHEVKYPNTPQEEHWYKIDKSNLGLEGRWKRKK